MIAIVIDDDMPTVDVIVKTVNWKRCHIENVYTAYNISAAEKIFQEQSVDIAVCDIEMPRGSGLDLLKWARQNGYETQFIFLTNHERFDFAQTAIQYNASGYVVKPFHAERLESELLIAAGKIRHEEKLREAAKYEEWFTDTIEYVESAFWNDLLMGRIDSDLQAIRAELTARKLPTDPEGKYRLILVASGSTQMIEEIWGEGQCGAYESALLQLAEQMIRDSGHKGSAICYRRRHSAYCALVLTEPQITDDVTIWAEQLQRLIGSDLHINSTVYISALYSIQDLPQVRERLENKDVNNVAAKGRVFGEDEELPEPEEIVEVLPDPDRIRMLLDGKKKKELLDLLAQNVNKLITGRKMSADTLIRLRQDLLQIIYVYLHEKGIQATQLFSGRNAVETEQKAIESVIDMMRWQVFLIATTIDYVGEVERSDSIIEKAKAFVREHYRENISRTEVAESLYLTPEYMAKLFKKETGSSLRQYITEIRIQKAKQLLASPGVRVSDVAEETGFDSFSYFSTVFKKETGMTPVEYKSQF